MCLYPKLIQNPKYKPNKKNGYNPQIPRDERIMLVPIGCGNCIECRRQKAREWQVRLNEEIRKNKNGQMVTLTFTENNLKRLTEIANRELNINEIEENEIATIAVRRFLERWRKKYKKSVRHWLVTELGHKNTQRIHLHGIIFTDHKEDIELIWQYGFVTLGDGVRNYVNEKTINYIVKYITKIDVDHKGYKSKILTSPGIGSNYLNRIDKNINKYNNTNTIEYYRTKTGLKISLPLYYKNKLYTDEEKENLWIHKINKQERWICGEKININQTETEYYETLKYYRMKNKRLGYGDDSKNWSVDQYKEMRKILTRNKSPALFPDPTHNVVRRREQGRE